MRHLLASLGLCFSTVLLAATANAQFQLQRLYTAPSTSQRPGCIVQRSDGNFYGTFVNTASQGSVFKMTPSGAVTTLATAFGINEELALGDDGNLYGTVNSQPAGGNTNGAIFKVTPAGQFSYVFVFDGTNGAHPVGMRKGMDGAFYGLMVVSNRFALPPASNHISIFEFTTNNAVTILHSATNGPDFTAIPVQGPDGNLYGSFFAPDVPVLPPFGSTSRISFYRLSTSGDFQTIYVRSNAPAAAGDMIFGPDGALYGAIGADMRQYPPNLTYGSIFCLTTNGSYSTLFSFDSTNGSDPQARLLLANDGYFYGSTFAGGISNAGTLFQISVHGEFTSLLDFTDTNGAKPSGPLIQAADGNFYGATESSKLAGLGTIFRLVQPIAISNFALSNSMATLSWNSFPGGIYRVDYRSNLSDTVWTPIIQRVTATDLTITIFDTFASDPQRFYRVALLP